jgi:hypothetical protein
MRVGPMGVMSSWSSSSSWNCSDSCDMRGEVTAGLKRLVEGEREEGEKERKRATWLREEEKFATRRDLIHFQEIIDLSFRTRWANGSSCGEKVCGGEKKAMGYMKR